MATFENTAAATPFGVFDNDAEFQSEADNMITFVKRKLGGQSKTQHEDLSSD